MEGATSAGWTPSEMDVHNHAISLPRTRGTTAKPVRGLLCRLRAGVHPSAAEPGTDPLIRYADLSPAGRGTANVCEQATSD
jgi:hypothetical protein